MDSKVREKIAKATVSVVHHSDNGTHRTKGVLVGGHIITVAHIFSREDGGVDCPKTTLVADRRGRVFGALYPAFLDPPSDVAVLRAPFFDESPREAEGFRKWVSSTRPLTLRTVLPPSSRPANLRSGEENFSVPCFTMVDGRHPIKTAIVLKPSANPFGGRERYIAFSAFKNGMSGSPIVDEAGDVIGLLSSGTTVNNGKMTTGTFPFVYRSLPQWLLESLV